MRLLLITNLYPPQELGGYGRCMADFAWGLQRGTLEWSQRCTLSDLAAQDRTRNR